MTATVETILDRLQGLGIEVIPKPPSSIRLTSGRSRAWNHRLTYPAGKGPGDSGSQAPATSRSSARDNPRFRSINRLTS